MKQTGKKFSKNKTRGFNNSAFLLVTLSAIAMAIVMIVLGRTAIPKVPISAPLTTQVLTSTTKPPTPSATLTPTIPSTTGTTTAETFTLDSFSKGSLTAPVTIVECSDFQCAHCQQFALTVEPQLEAEYVDTGKVRVIYKFTVTADESLLADQAAACAAEQGKFWDYYYLLMGQRSLPTVNDLPIEKLQGLAQQLGLDMDQFNASLLSGKYKAKVIQDDQESRDLGVTGTPTFFINGIKKDGASSLRDLQIIIDPILRDLGY